LLFLVVGRGGGTEQARQGGRTEPALELVVGESLVELTAVEPEELDRDE
jgi:hypothetical protein